jgi:hypothetical protein
MPWAWLLLAAAGRCVKEEDANSDWVEGKYSLKNKKLLGGPEGFRQLSHSNYRTANMENSSYTHTWLSLALLFSPAPLLTVQIISDLSCCCSPRALFRARFCI